MVLKPILYTTGVGGSITVSLDIPFILEFIGTETGTTDTVTATPSGGSGTYTYAWTFISGPSGVGSLAIGSAATAATDFDWSGLTGITQDVFATARCTVTDTLGNTGFSNLSINITRGF